MEPGLSAPRSPLSQSEHTKTPDRSMSEIVKTPERAEIVKSPERPEPTPLRRAQPAPLEVAISLVCRAMSPPKVWALRALDAARAEAICAAASLEELRRVAVPFGEVLADEVEPDHLGTWMIWMVHRVYLNDPTVEALDFSAYRVPSPAEEPRILPKLLAALPRNSHLARLLLQACGLAGRELAKDLAESLRAESGALKVLDLSRNVLQPEDLQVVFSALAKNCTVQRLSVSDQASDLQANFETFQSLHKSLKANTSLLKLGMDLTDAHWRDQIGRCLLRNVDRARRLRSGKRPSEGRRSSFSSEDGCV